MFQYFPFLLFSTGEIGVEDNVYVIMKKKKKGKKKQMLMSKNTM